MLIEILPPETAVPLPVCSNIVALLVCQTSTLLVDARPPVSVIENCCVAVDAALSALFAAQ
jgi:hypothetical protein